MAKFFIGLVVALWAAWFGVVVLGVVKFTNPAVAPVSVGVASMLAFVAVLYALVWAAREEDMPRGGEY